jgi:hypothetical protein
MTTIASPKLKPSWMTAFLVADSGSGSGLSAMR